MIDVDSQDWLPKLLPRVVALAREAGSAIMSFYSDLNPAVEYKHDGSPLSEADLASSRIILDGLSRLSHDWPVLSEETEQIAFEQRESWLYFWLVDPLDGTKEFLQRNGEFTVNIALVRGTMPILGVVYAPVIERMYFAAKGVGAHRADCDTVCRIEARRARCDTVRTVVSRSHSSAAEELARFAFSAEGCEVIMMGSSLKFCLVAEGFCDNYPRSGPTMEWDTAAAHCILEEAGGVINDLNGNSISYNKPNLMNSGFIAKGTR